MMSSNGDHRNKPIYEDGNHSQDNKPSQFSSFTKRATVNISASLFVIACLVSSSISPAHAQPTENIKIAIIFRDVEIHESHDPVGRANWRLYGSVGGASEPGLQGNL